MAEANVSVAWEQFTCPVCLDLLNDPVTIPCGHSYCIHCITHYWNHEDQEGDYSCPQCRQCFNPRPALNKSTILAEMVEKLKTKFHTAVPAHSYAGPGDVGCDVCSGIKYEAIKSCLTCLTSYCQNHLEQHDTLFKGKRHNLMDATGRLQEMVCRKHDKQLEIYCRTDGQCICYLCTVDEHRTHDTVTAVAERTDKQKQLGSLQKEIKTTIQRKEKDVHEMKTKIESFKSSAQAAVEDSEKTFTKLIRSIEESRSEVTQMIRDQETAAVSRAEDLLKLLEQEISDLRQRNTEVEQLLKSDDHIHFLQSFQDLAVFPEFTDVDITPNSLLSFEDLGKSVSMLRGKFEDFYKEEKEKITRKVRCLQIIPGPDPQTRDEFLQYFHQFTLDPNTVNKQLCLYSGNRAVKNTDKCILNYPAHPDRFDCWLQVLCKESICGRCYWEFEWNRRDIGVSVSYKTMCRKGGCFESRFGYNDQSWRLNCTPSSFSFIHNNKNTELPVPLNCCRIGVYVDHGAGMLSFYNVSDTMTLIHKIQTTFTQPLYPGFVVCSGSSVEVYVL